MAPLCVCAFSSWVDAPSPSTGRQPLSRSSDRSSLATYGRGITPDDGVCPSCGHVFMEAAVTPETRAVEEATQFFHAELLDYAQEYK
jgi:hypothetical protein